MFDLEKEDFLVFSEIFFDQKSEGASGWWSLHTGACMTKAIQGMWHVLWSLNDIGHGSTFLGCFVTFFNLLNVVLTLFRLTLLRQFEP